MVTSNHPPAQDNPTLEDSIMTEQISLLDDQLVDMRFITKLTGLTDKWFYKLIKTDCSRSQLSWAGAPAGRKVKSNYGYSNALPIHAVIDTTHSIKLHLSRYPNP